MTADLEREIRRVNDALNRLRQQVGPDETEVLGEALEELSTTLEELEVTSEELRQQNETLRATQQRLAEERRDFQELFDLAPGPYLVTDTAGVIRRANRAAATLLGVRHDLLVGRILPMFVPDDERAAFRRQLLRLAEGKEIEGWEFTVVPRDGAALQVSAHGRVARDEAGKIDSLRWLLRDITEARQAQAELQVAFAESAEEAAQLRDIDRWKDAFLSAAAHDLRSPLSIITGAAETLITHPELDSSNVQMMVERILAHARRLDTLLTDLLDLDRFTRGVVAAERRPTDLTALVRGVVDATDCKDHPIEIQAQPVTADLDSPRVEQIVANLLRNAVTHTPAGTPIRISTSGDAREVTIVVEDEGPGVPAEVRDTLFSPFVTTAPHGDDRPGTGIGLSLVQLFAELHGGTARVEDRPGGGARFVVELPAGT